MAPRFVYPLSELDGSRVDVAGGKGASLGELTAAGIDVPPGFVVASDAFHRFLAGSDEAVGVSVRAVDAGELDAVEAAERIRSLLATSPVPGEIATAIEEARGSLEADRVSVRSSATCEDGADTAWAGQLDTYLDVPPDEILANVRECWLSIFSERALSYGAAHGYGAGEFGVAVVVQRMVASEVSGIGFSVHPLTQEPDLMLIEAGLGLGEAVVSGAIRPDQFVVRRSTNEIVEQSVGEQTRALSYDPAKGAPAWHELGVKGSEQKLTNEAVHEYASLLDRIDSHYGHPVDTEWAMEAGRFFLLQARPITTLSPEYRDEVVDGSVSWRKLVRRPMSLLEASLWSHTWDAEHAERALGLHSDHTLTVQDEGGMVTLAQPVSVMGTVFGHIGGLLHDDRAALVDMLRHGLALYETGFPRIERGPDAFSGLQEAGDFLIEAATFTRLVPVVMLNLMNEHSLEDPELTSLAEELRANTIYPQIERQIVSPLATDALEQRGFPSPERANDVALWTELLDGATDLAVFQTRLDEVDAGRHFVYQRQPDRESVTYHDETGYLVMRLAGRRQIEAPDDPDVIAGQAAWPGVQRARARVILDSDPRGQTIEDGEVLVSIQSSPALMPLLRRAGAIVTDEGGVVCHAAIICRELKIPTIIGTGRATTAIRTGDLIEVDASEGVIRILERA